MRRKRVRAICLVLAVLLLLYSGWKLWEGLRPPSNTRWRTLMADGRMAYQNMHFRRAEHCYLAALREARKFGLRDVRVADGYEALAELYATECYIWKTRPANTNPLRALISATREGPRAMLGAAEAAGDMAHARQRSRHRNENVLLVQQALSIYRRAYRPNDPLLAQHYEELARLFLQAGKSRQAVTLYQDTLHVYELAYGKDSVQLIPILNALIDTVKLIDSSSMHPYLLRMWEINNKVYGTGDERTSRAFTTLIKFDFDHGYKQEANQLCLSELKRVEKQYGPSSVELLPALTQLANVYRRGKQYDKAEPLFRRGIAITERLHHRPFEQMTEANVIGAPHWELVLPLLDSYGWQLEESGRKKEAYELWRRLTD